MNTGEIDSARPTIAECFRNLWRHPVELLVVRWNWKAAFFSSMCRGAIFFFANLHAGLAAASGAMTAEFSYRAVTAGFYAALTQAFCRAEPRRRATLIVMAGLPVFSHLIEFVVHWLHGTPNLRASIGASIVFTVISTMFNLHAMRHGVLIAGRGGRSLWGDLRSLPRAIASFVLSGFGFLPVPAALCSPDRAPDKKNIFNHSCFIEK